LCVFSGAAPFSAVTEPERVVLLRPITSSLMAGVVALSAAAPAFADPPRGHKNDRGRDWGRDNDRGRDWGRNDNRGWNDNRDWGRDNRGWNNNYRGGWYDTRRYHHHWPQGPYHPPRGHPHSLGDKWCGSVPMSSLAHPASK